MKTKLAALLIVLIAAPACYAIGGISVGPYYGMAMPIANDLVKSGSIYGIQAKVSLIPLIAVGGYYNSRAYGAPTIDTESPLGILVGTKSDVTSFGGNVYLGQTSGSPGVNMFLIASFGTYKWDSKYYESDTRTATSLGPGIEFILPMKVGIEGRGMLELAASGEDEITGKRKSWKSFCWFIGVNYHFNLGPGI